MKSMMARDELEYGWMGNDRARKMFREHHGEPPYPCDFCDELIYVMGHRGVIHHRNHIPRDDRIENLGAAHKGCHNVHHGIGQNHTPEVIEKIRQTHLGSKRSAETRRRLSEFQRGRPGRPHTDEARRKISEGHQRRWLTRDRSAIQRDEKGRFSR